MRILLVEDESAIADSLAKLLRGRGHNVVVARNGKDAVEFADQKEPLDIAVIDLVLPFTSGTDVMKDIRFTRPGLPVVFVTGLEVDWLERLAALPNVRLLTKPHTVEELEEAMNKLTTPAK